MASSDPPGYVLVEGYPSVEDYVHLRTASGLTPKTEEQASAALKGSWYGVYAAEEAAPTKAVAMGRIVGDGGWYFFIADMATLPEHQRRGLGNAIMTNLLARIRSHAAKGTAYVVLGADAPGRKLYAKHGFRDTMPSEMGMGLQIEVEGAEK
ncbi:acyl-CoA N-acyltransferase [Nemania sp. NC0429]|nr:acyl-CoA N-acyltransferase [Nemania sp. NC0429]